MNTLTTDDGGREMTPEQLRAKWKEAEEQEHQRKTALRAEFEAAVESENPPSVTTLVKRGKRQKHPKATPKEIETKALTSLLVLLEGALEFSQEVSLLNAYVKPLRAITTAVKAQRRNKDHEEERTRCWRS